MKKVIEPGTADLIIKMQQQLISLERKVDTLLSQSSSRPVEAKPFHKPFQQPGRTHGHGGGGRDDNFRDRERILYKAICADCNKECQVPFRPSQDRPVYCKECFASRKAAPPFEVGRDNRPKEKYIPHGRTHDRPFDKHQDGGKRRHSERKKPSSKRRKK